MSDSRKSADKCPLKPLHEPYQFMMGKNAPCPRTYTQDFVKGACNESGKKSVGLVGAAAIALFLIKGH